jgi:hypothetical protein
MNLVLIAIPFLGGKGKTDPFRVDIQQERRMKRIIKAGIVSTWDVTTLTEILNNSNHPFLVDPLSTDITQSRIKAIDTLRECRNDLAHSKKGTKRDMEELRKIVNSLVAVCNLLLDVDDKRKLLEVDLVALQRRAKFMSSALIEEYTKLVNTNSSIKTSFEDTIRECMTSFIGRDWLYDRINGCFETGHARVAVVLGDAGIGE